MEIKIHLDYKTIEHKTTRIQLEVDLYDSNQIPFSTSENAYHSAPVHNSPLPPLTQVDRGDGSYIVVLPIKCLIMPYGKFLFTFLLHCSIRSQLSLQLLSKTWKAFKCLLNVCMNQKLSQFQSSCQCP